jgi:hypothetical protein
MDWFGHLLQWSSVVLQVCILALMIWRGLLRRFPLFATYTAYIICITMLRSVVLSNRMVYFYTYWATEPGEILLGLLAVHESFLRIFRVFYAVRWFRILFPGTIAFALVYSGWIAYAHPPRQVSPAGAAIISAAVASEYVIVGISVLFFALVLLFRVRWRIYEFRIVLGFGISALTMVFAGIVRSENGTKFVFLSTYAPPMAYFLAVLIWLSAMLRPGAIEVLEVKDAPDVLAEDLRGHLSAIKRLLKRS